MKKLHLAEFLSLAIQWCLALLHIVLLPRTGEYIHHHNNNLRNTNATAITTTGYRRLFHCGLETGSL